MSTSIPAVSRLSSVVIRILGCNPGPMTLQGTNIYLLGNGGKRLLVDTGESNVREFVDILQNVLTTENASINNIILTHWHHDHIGGVLDILKSINLPDCKIWKYRRSDDQESNKIGNYNLHFLENGQEFVTDGVTIKVEHTPGHTTDHIALSLKETNGLFSGDCILGEGTAVFEDLHDYMLSLKRILAINPSVIYPGHGPVIEDPVDRIQYYIRHRNQRETEIIRALNDNSNKTWDEMELVNIVYKNTPKHLYPAASLNVNHHLEKLFKENKVLKANGKWMLKSNI